MTAALVVAVLLPAVVGTFLAVGGRAVDRLAVPASIGTAAVTVAASVTAAITRPTVSVGFLPAMVGATAGLRVDALAAVVLPVMTGIALLVLLFAVADRVRPAGRFHGLMLIFTAAVVVTVTAATLPTLLAAWEIMGAASYVLIGFHWRDPARVAGGFTAFIATRTGDLGLYLAAGAAVAGGGQWQLATIGSGAGPWQNVIAAGLLAAGLGKAAQLPFSFWISGAMRGPSPVSALLHSAAMVAMGGYLLLRTESTLSGVGWAAPTAAWIGAVTSIVLGLVALAQRDLKQVLAASTAAQLGFVVLAAGTGTAYGGAVQLIAHAATKALLFLAAGAWLTATGTKQLAALRGVARRWPATGVLATVGALSLSGLPPLSLWFGKDAALAAAKEQSPALYAAGLLGAAIAAAYSARIINLVWRRPATSEEARAAESGWDTELTGSRHVPAGSVSAMIVLAIPAAGLAALEVSPLTAFFRGLQGPAPSAPEVVTSAVITVLIVGLVLWRSPVLRIGSDWFGMRRLAAAGIGRPMKILARTAAMADRGLDLWVDGCGRAVDRLAGRVAWLDDHGFDAAVNRIGSGAAAIGRLARRTQTGRIHHYFLGAAAVVGASVFLLLIVR